MFKIPNQYRLRKGLMGSDDDIGNNGCFDIPFKTSKGKKVILACIASDGCDWEHVSCYKIYANQRFIPSWNEMCFIKNLFWDEEDCVMQLHPPKANYVNNNPFVLHLWRPIGLEIPQPPVILV